MGAGHKRATRLRGRFTLEGGLELSEPVQLFRRQARRDGDRQRENTNIGTYWYGRVATSHIRLAANPADNDTFSITLTLLQADGSSLFEFAQEFIFTSGSGGDRTPIVVGATAADTAANMLTAIQSVFDSSILKVSQDGTTIDLQCEQDQSTLVAASTATALAIQNNAENLSADIVHLYAIDHAVTAEDVARGKIVIDTDLDEILWLQMAAVRTDAFGMGMGGTPANSQGALLATSDTLPTAATDGEIATTWTLSADAIAAGFTTAAAQITAPNSRPANTVRGMWAVVEVGGAVVDERAVPWGGGPHNVSPGSYQYSETALRLGAGLFCSFQWDRLDAGDALSLLGHGNTLPADSVVKLYYAQ